MSHQTSSVTVTTGARLHFGLILGTAQTGWQYGGIGVMVRQPGWHMRCTPANSSTDQLSGEPAATARIAQVLESIRRQRTVPPLSIHVDSGVPFHAGLGGGTQLALAIAAVCELISQRRLPENIFELADLTNRAERSAIGTAGFRSGGFLIDRGLDVRDGSVGKNREGEAPAEPGIRQDADCGRVHKLTMPDDWRFVLIRPTDAQGLCGERERSFFSRPDVMPDSLVAMLGSLVDADLVPSIRAGRFADFAASLAAYGNATGAYYAREQGGVFAHPAIRDVVGRLQAAGFTGAAQSSWGPGIAIPARDDDHAAAIASEIPSTVSGHAMSVTITKPMNTGATIRTPALESGSGVMA